MHRLVYPFWNREEHRMRAFWRLLAQVVMLIAGLLLLVPLATSLEHDAGYDLIMEFATGLAMVGSVWLCARLLDRRRMTDLGLRLDRDWWCDLAFGLVLGLAMIAAFMAIAGGAGWISVRAVPVLGEGETSLSVVLLCSLAEFVLVGVGEELLSRGYHLRNLAEGFRCRRIGPRTAIIISVVLSSTVFAALHLSNEHTSMLSSLNTLLSGIVLALGLVWTGRLALPIGIHITWNFAQGSLAGLPVSGHAPRAALLTVTDTGPELWTGGAYGVEGGLLGMLIVLAAIPAMLLWTRVRHGRAEFATAIAEYGPRPNNEACESLE